MHHGKFLKIKAKGVSNIDILVKNTHGMCPPAITFYSLGLLHAVNTNQKNPAQNTPPVHGQTTQPNLASCS